MIGSLIYVVLTKFSQALRKCRFTKGIKPISENAARHRGISIGPKLDPDRITFIRALIFINIAPLSAGLIFF